MGYTMKPAASIDRGSYRSADDLVDVLAQKIDSIRTPGDVTAWMDLCRTARQPYILWRVDYLEPRESLATVNRLIRESEDILYESKTSINLREGYSADLQQQSAFNTIRAHLRAEEKEFDAALTIFQALLDDFYDQLTPIRQSNLLMHCCLAFVACGQFRNSYECFKKHWFLLKHLPEGQRLSLGVWDNHVILHMIYWFLSSYIRDFRDFYEIESGAESNILTHKKISLLKCLDYDQTWVASFFGKPFYEHLCEQYSTMLPWSKRTTTPENFLELWETVPGQSLRKEKKGLLPIERQYFERYNKQFLPHTRPDEDEVENCLYSYYHFQDPKAVEVSLQDSLQVFLMEHLDSDAYKTILSVGPGLGPPPEIHGRVVTVVDISEHVCQRLHKIGFNAIHGCMSKFIRETNERFDLCIARDVLQNLSKARLDVFLHHLPAKCDHLAALIDLRTDVRSDILSGASLVKEVPLHKSILSEEEWISRLEQGFEIEYKKENYYLYVYGKSKA